MIDVEIDVDDEETRALWVALGDLAGRLPGDWVLVGGLMVQIHAIEGRMADVRVTHDIDVLGQATAGHAEPHRPRAHRRGVRSPGP
jgi:hypothetical protein